MRKVRELLWLTHEPELSVRQVSGATGVGKMAVGEYICPRQGDRHHVADPGRAERHRAGAAAFLCRPDSLNPFFRQHRPTAEVDNAVQ